MITHVPFLFPLYFLITNFIEFIFSSIPNIFRAIDYVFVLFTLFIPLSHLIFLSLSHSSPLKNLNAIQMEIKRNLNLIEKPSPDEEKKHPYLQLGEINVDLFKFVMNGFKFLFLMGLNLFCCFEIKLYGFHWLFLELLYLSFAIIYASYFAMKIYEKLKLNNEKILFWCVLLMSYGIVKEYSHLILEIMPLYF